MDSYLMDKVPLRVFCRFPQTKLISKILLGFIANDLFHFLPSFHLDYRFHNIIS